MNTKLMKASLVSILAMLLVSACGVIPMLGSRNIISENRNVSGFDRLEVSGGGDVTIIQDGTEALKIETDDNVMQYVTSKVQGGTLSIGLEFPSLRSVIPSRLRLTLHVKDLSGIITSGSWNVVSESFQTRSLDIAISGSGKVTIHALTTDKLTVEISGSGEMDMAGNVKSQDVTISGSGSYNAGDLQTQDTKVGVSGSGNLTTWVTGSLDASISGMGTISYYGSPQVAFNQSGSGTIKSLGNK
jgi:Protein of unknown function (DUF2807).